MWPLREATVWKARWQHLKRLDELVTSFISELGSIFSEEEQRTALEALLLGKDVFALPSTGFVKSLINRQAQLVVEIYSCWCDWLAWDTVIDSWFVQSPAKVFFSFFFLSCLPKLFCGDAFPDGSVSKTIWLDRFELSSWTFEMNNIWE